MHLLIPFRLGRKFEINYSVFQNPFRLNPAFLLRFPDRSLLHRLTRIGLPSESIPASFAKSSFFHAQENLPILYDYKYCSYFFHKK